MMKKGKVLSLLLAGGLACVALAACGGEEKGGDPSSLTADTDFEALVSDKVTAAVWNAAFSNEAFAGCSWTYCDYDDGELERTLKGGFGYRKDGAVTEVLLGYYEQDGEPINQSTMNRLDSEKLTVYFPDGAGGFYYEETLLTDMDARELHRCREWTVAFRLFSIDLAGQFSKFTYDETLSAYTYESKTGIQVDYSPFEAMSDHYTVYKAEVKIVGGKVAYQHITIDEIEYTLCCYNFGETTVSIPENAVPAPEEY